MNAVFDIPVESGTEWNVCCRLACSPHAGEEISNDVRPLNRYVIRFLFHGDEAMSFFLRRFVAGAEERQKLV